MHDNAELPTGLVVASVAPAFGALHQAYESSIRIPDDMSIVAIHDSPLAEYSIPPLTTVRMPLRELGALALQKIQDMIAGKDVVTETIVEPEPAVIIRGSARQQD